MPSPALTVKTHTGRYSPFSKKGSGCGSPGAENGNWRARGDSSSDVSSSPPSSPSTPVEVTLPAAHTSGNDPRERAGKPCFISYVRTNQTKVHDLVSFPKYSTLPIYTINDLLLLQKSPLARMSPETRGAIKENVPEIVLSRKQRHNMKRNGQSPSRRTNATHNAQPAPEQPSLAMIPAVPPRPATIVPIRRDQSRMRTKRRASKSFVDELSWRRVQRSRTNSIFGAAIVAQ